MNVETVKWSWAEDVKKKEVYRDDELIRSKTKEEALQAVGFLLEQHQGNSYSITVFRDGEYLTYSRHRMPCLGGLVKYRDSHGPRYKMNPYFPRDIRVAFPEGDIIYIGCYRNGLKALMETPYYKFIFSEESPWVSAFGSRDTIIFKDNYFVLTNMDTDPTVFYSMMRLGGVAYGAVQTTLHPKVTLLVFKSSEADPRRLAGQKPVRTSGGKWSEGFGYTRPYNESIFKTQLPTKAKDFDTLPSTSYPPGFSFTKEYFVTKMKEEFKLDVSNIQLNLNISSETEEMLVKSWDYFKEKAKELDE